MKLAEALLTALQEHGAREIFGIPGDFALPFFKVVEETGILPLYTLSHEPGVGFAADAAARFNCGLGVAAVTYGVGAFNLVNPIAGAYAEKSPVVVISAAPGAIESRGGLLLHHQAKTLESQFRVFSEITCDVARLDDPARAPAEIGRVLRSCREHSQPVYIELPRDMVAVECAPVPRLRPTPVDPDALKACAEEVLDRLSGARSPVLMVGVEVRRYGLESKVAELARKLALPVVTSFMGRGLLADSGAPLIGTYLGAAGGSDITRLVEDSDALLMLGVIPADTNFGASNRQVDLRKTIQALDREVRLGYHVYPRISLAALTEALLQRVETRAVGESPPMRKPPRGMVPDEAPISPTDIAFAVNDLMDREGPMAIASDMGDCLFTAMDIEYTQLVAPGYYGTMGFGVPAGLGVQATTGKRPLILVGDGAFQMTGCELGNCRRYQFDPIVLLFNNGGWGMMRTIQPESGFNDLGEWDYAKIAACLGGSGERVTTRRALKEALDRAFAERGRFHLIEVVIPRDTISPTLSRFMQAMQRFQKSGS